MFFLTFSHLKSDEVTKLHIEIYKNLRCLVCQGQSIADSNSEFAQTVKLVVKDKINEGKSKKEIYEFLISKYGEWIVYQPRFNRGNFLLWFLPYLILIFGAIIIYALIKKRKNNKAN
ncbi:MAG: cytochrome c-type biogenesis protein CcmH [Pelagibacterales bacterium MED-G40]|nr:MAG: cytochrome c-type biogenesis protein CcmH [Pelagibacterales bacterium MED-G40]